MAGSLNKVMLIGNLGKDPESKALSGGTSVVKFSLATSESWKDKRSGDWVDKTEWHNVVIFAEFPAKYVMNNLRKGSKVYVEGKLQTRKWQNNEGKDVYTTEIVISGYDGRVVGLSPSEGKREPGAPEGSYGSSLKEDRSAPAAEPAGLWSDAPDEDDIPF